MENFKYFFFRLKLSLYTSKLVEIFLLYLLIFLISTILIYLNLGSIHFLEERNRISKSQQIDLEIKSIEWLRDLPAQKKIAFKKFLSTKPDFAEVMKSYLKRSYRFPMDDFSVSELSRRYLIEFFHDEPNIREIIKNLPRFYLLAFTSNQLILGEDFSFCSRGYSSLTPKEKRELLNFSIDVYLKAREDGIKWEEMRGEFDRNT